MNRKGWCSPRLGPPVSETRSTLSAQPWEGGFKDLSRGLAGMGTGKGTGRVGECQPDGSAGTA